MTDLAREAFVNGYLAALREGAAAVPMALLRRYKELGLTDGEAMLLIHLMAFREKENKEFPTLEELQARMSASAEDVIGIVQKLLKHNWITIDERLDETTRVQYETYNIAPLLARLAGASEQIEAPDATRPSEPSPAGPAKPIQRSHDIYKMFETEFARPLSPMEIETIAGWLDEDRYPQELIMHALKEAVFAGKLHFRYIDRILLEWQRNRIRTVEQAKEHSKQFRGR